jgi:hypothetical protein
MFDFFEYILGIIFGYENWWIVPRFFVILISPILLPIAFVLDIIFGILYRITDLYYYLV